MLRKNNKGITIIEVLLAIAVTAILGTLITGFIIYSTRSYGKSINESTLQEDAQVILAQLNSYIINADDTIEYKVNGVLCKSDALSGEGTFSTKELAIYKNVGTAKTVEYITWTAADQKLTYRMDNIDSSGSVSTAIAEETLATKISDFKVDLTNLDSSKQVKVELSVDGTSGAVYSADTTVYLRNGRVSSVSTTPTTPVVSSVTSVTVIPASKDLKLGESWDFNARVYGTNNPSQEVTWSLEGNTSTHTTVNTDTGEVYVDPSEDSETIVVRATSVQDPSKSGIGYVYVDSSTKLSLGSIRDYWIYTGHTLYLYGRPAGTLTGAISWSVDTSQGAGSYSLAEISEKPGAASFKANQAGDYTIRISGTVDGVEYKDKAIVHVRDVATDYNVNGNKRDKISIVPDAGTPATGWDYWVCPGGTVSLNTIVDETDSIISMRKWTGASSSRIPSASYTAVASGDNNEKMTVTIGSDCKNGEIVLRATVGNEYQKYYDEVTIHVYQSNTVFKHPYIIETTKMDDTSTTSSNAYFLRNMVAGPVNIASSTADLELLNSTKLSNILGTNHGYETVSTDKYDDVLLNVPIDSSKSNTYIWTPEDVTSVSLKSNGEVRIGANCDLLATEKDLEIAAPKITTAEDTIIWVKGDHTLTLKWGSLYFDGIIYAPEGTVNIECSKGMFRGIIIAKEVNISSGGWGDDEIGIMEKQSVMELFKSLQ